MLTADRPLPEIPLELPAKLVHRGNKGYKGPDPYVEAMPMFWPSDSPAVGMPPELGMGFGEMNPKTLMGRKKLPVLSVVPSSGILREAEAMAYGAYEAPRADGGRGYGPYNWRAKAVEYMTYIDAVFRHCKQAVEGEDIDPQSGAWHLGHAKASLGILIDAIDNGTVIDDRPPNKNTATRILDEYKERKS